MKKVKEYYPSLVTSEYKLGEFYMFVRNITFLETKISDNYVTDIERTKETSGFDEDKKVQPGFIEDCDETGEAMTGFDVDSDRTEYMTGGLDKEDEIVLEKSFDTYKKYRKCYGKYRYEVGKIIGVNETDGKIYVKFEDTRDGYCHVFKTGIASDQFDMIDKLVQKFGSTETE